MKYRRKPVEVEAMKYPGLRELAEAKTVLDWLDQEGGAHQHAAVGLMIVTDWGWSHVRPGDWVVKQADGEFVVSRPDEFAATYEPVAV